MRTHSSTIARAVRNHSVALALLSVAPLLSLTSGCSSSEAPVEMPDMAQASVDAAPQEDGPAADLAMPSASPQLATVELEGGKPRLYVQDLEGNGRHRIEFHDLRSTLPDENFPDTAVDDDSVIAFPGLSFSPDGKKLAVSASIAYDESQIVLIDLATGTQRVVSHNGQYIMGDPAWSPDGHTLAYAMSVIARATYLELFTSDLDAEPVTIKQHTSGTGLPHLGVGLGEPLRYIDGGGALAFSMGAYEQDAPFDLITDIHRISLASDAIDDLTLAVRGTVSDVLPDHSKVLVIRQVALNSDGSPDDALVVRDVATGAEDTLLQHAQIVGAQFDAAHEEVRVTVDHWTPATDHLYSIQRIGISDGHFTEVPMPTAVGSVIRLAVTR